MASPARHRRFRQLCDLIIGDVRRADGYFAEGALTDEGLGFVVEVLAHLEELYRCGWGEGEYLKRVVVAIQSQVNNAAWDRAHLAFLQEFMPYLRNLQQVDDKTVDVCFAAIRRHDLDPFRGSLSMDGSLRRHGIEDVREP